MPLCNEMCIRDSFLPAMPFASLYADFLPPPGAVAEQNQTGTQQLVRDQSDPGAVQAPAQFIDGQKGQGRPDEKHREEGDHRGGPGIPCLLYTSHRP